MECLRSDALGPIRQVCESWFCPYELCDFSHVSFPMIKCLHFVNGDCKVPTSEQCCKDEKGSVHATYVIEKGPIHRRARVWLMLCCYGFEILHNF